MVELGLGDLVAFCGFLDGRRKKAALWDADLFVLPSFHENFGMAVIEAMSMGVPVLISDQVGVHREVAEYGAGLVIRCDGEDIAQGLQRLLDDEPLRHDMGKNGKRLVQEKFIWPRVGEQLVNLYHLILASNDRSAQRGNSNAG